MRETDPAASAATRSTAAAAICWIVAAVVYLLAETLTASAFPGYSYAMNYISDLGVPDVEMLGNRPVDSPLHMVINIAFVAQGLLFAAAAVCFTRCPALPLRLPIIVVGLVHALGMVIIAVVNGGQHNNELGLGWVHLLGALFAFFGGHATAICIGISLLMQRSGQPIAAISIAIGLIGVLGIVMLQVDVRAIPGMLLPDGVWERIGMYAVVAWELLFGAFLLARRSRKALSKSPAAALD
ncbi:DUF998 domain-containing protein [Brevibacterium marinum]|uniref:Putative membrane protein n=1 Tax=Brevibacterium marinum TaxID=418643 RepID=A0A846S7J6_9MICO|nr:DUF998 domain-containing protein [Brevibacterium marinum]NJC58021.1 putative membrane protein [Brevibacterium marinum]